MAKPNVRVIRFVLSAGAGWARTAVGNCVKYLTGREVAFNERALFLRQYILHVTRIRPIRLITCVRRRAREGSGSQALMVMCAINFARATGLTYVHTPFVTVHHGGDRPMEEWVHEWEDLFNLGAGEIPCTAPRYEVVNYYHNFLDIELCFGWDGRTHELARHFAGLIPEFRQKYYRGRQPRTAREVTVAIHIRRGDVSATQNSSLFTANEVVLQTARNVKAVLDVLGVPYQFDVYSNGDASEFKEFSAFGARVFTDPASDPVWTMKELIEADVLIMAQSSFSCYAALISDGIKIFVPSAAHRRWAWTWWDRFPTDDWIPCRPDGAIDLAAFSERLDTLIHLKQAAQV